MQAINKKGFAEALTTLVLITITIAAVLLAAGSITKLLSTMSNIQTSPEFNCLEAQIALNPELEITNACYNSQSGDIEITLKRGVTDAFINSLSFAIEDETWRCSNSCSDCQILGAGKTKTYFLPAENPARKTIRVYADNCELDYAIMGECG